MKKKLLFVLIPLLLASISGCVKYNGQDPQKDKVKPDVTSETSDDTSSSSSDTSDTSNSSDTSATSATSLPIRHA